MVGWYYQLCQDGFFLFPKHPQTGHRRTGARTSRAASMTLFWSTQERAAKHYGKIRQERIQTTRGSRTKRARRKMPRCPCHRQAQQLRNCSDQCGRWLKRFFRSNEYSSAVCRLNPRTPCSVPSAWSNDRFSWIRITMCSASSQVEPSADSIVCARLMESGTNPDTPAAPDNIAVSLRKSRLVCIVIFLLQQFDEKLMKEQSQYRAAWVCRRPDHSIVILLIQSRILITRFQKHKITS
jgi:hypothetical protein